MLLSVLIRFYGKKISVPEFLRSARSSFLLFPIKKENRQRLYNLLSIFILKLIFFIYIFFSLFLHNYILYLHTYPHTIYCLCTFLFYALLHRFKLQYIFYQLYDRIVFIQILKHHRIIYICCHCPSYFRCGK